MPRFNGTGPFGSGAGTGWGLGPCGARMANGRRGGGRGRGFGWRRPWDFGINQPQITKKEEREILKDESMDLEEELKVIKDRLSNLKD